MDFKWLSTSVQHRYHQASLKAGRSVRISTWPDGNVPASLLIEHREIASAASLHFALSGLLSKHSYSFIPLSFIQLTPHCNRWISSDIITTTNIQRILSPTWLASCLVLVASNRQLAGRCMVSLWRHLKSILLTMTDCHSWSVWNNDELVTMSQTECIPFALSVKLW
jgi:hypothetical protein